ncbi:LysE family translocator [Gilvimarinus sp. 1_MG-2023]|uniref:LysE family translocator n=1 Tax=Gilvimarinus sp. 1_MG-2023 TaxID=3062638 RepID=UPI0026E13666|nr:LysE family translocator [Gilvimarinus sp. 1_MG-2023]MDO6748563.1 LysE family translocator [Gilvimarinus sp. 1_MG-2023]
MSDALLTQLTIIAVMTGSPGPNNLLLITTGVHFGFHRSLPLVVGIVLGCATMLLATTLGFHQLLQQIPASKMLLSIFSAGFLSYLVVRLWRTSSLSASPALARPWRISEGAAFQWVNPKAWFMCLALASAEGSADTLFATGLLILLFCLVATPLLLLWGLAGSYLTAKLNQPGWLRRFNRLMALSLLACVISLLADL